MPIDHVLIAVADAEATAAALWRNHGLRAVAGGLHPGWGTGNWIMPLGEAYLELVRIDDPDVAIRSPFGRRAAAVIEAGGGPYAWCVRPRDFEATVARLGLPVEPGSRLRPDGVAIAWRSAGLAVALADPSCPFFIDWQMGADQHPGRGTAVHRGTAPTLTRLEVSGAEATVRAWLGEAEPAVLVRPGPPAVLAITIASSDGVAVLEAADWH